MIDDDRSRQPLLRSFPLGSRQDNMLRHLLELLREQASDREQILYDEVLSGRRDFSDLQDIESFRVAMSEGSRRAAIEWKELDPTEKLRLIQQGSHPLHQGSLPSPPQEVNDDEAW